MGLMWLVLPVVSVARAEAPQSIEEFNALEPKWPLLEGATFTIEGRYASFSPTRLKLEKCKLDFIFAGSFPNPPRDSKVVQLKGHLERREADLVFVVTDLQPLPNDVSLFRTRRGKVPSNQPEEWYKLAAWGAHRAEYYRDDELKAEAVAAFTQGVLAEHRNLSPVTAEDLRRLASKLSNWNADPRMQVEYHHEACRLDYNTFLRKQNEGDVELITELRKRLPGVELPLTKEDEASRVKYLAAPLLEFKNADDELRKKFARVLYVEILKHRIMRDAAPDGKNGFSIAQRIETQLPELSSMGAEYREKELAYHLDRVGSMTRKEMTALVTKLEPLKQPQYLDQLKRRWFTEREKQVDPASAAGWVELGDDFGSILGDTQSSIRCYIRAYKISPGTQGISDWLTEQGMQLHKGEWLAKGEIPAETDDPITAAVRAGVVQSGMNEEQVRSALGVEPTRRTRIATSGHVQEWWLFEDHGLSVQFTRRRRPEPSLVTKVIRLSDQPQSTKIKPEKPVGTEGF